MTEKKDFLEEYPPMTGSSWHFKNEIYNKEIYVIQLRVVYFEGI